MENSFIVLSNYLYDIEYCYKEYISYVSKQCSSELTTLLYNTHADISSSFKRILDTVPASEVESTKNMFRLKLIRNRIFSPLYTKSIYSQIELFEVFIQIENNIVDFIEECFCSFSYIKSKCMVDKIVGERHQIIDKLCAQKKSETISQTRFQIPN